MEINKTTYEVNGPCGSGKTYYLVNHMEQFKAPWNSSQKYIISAISVNLGKYEIAPLLQMHGFKTLLINSSENPNISVARQLAEVIKEFENDTRVALIITHQAYDTFDNKIFDKKYQILQDEGAGLEKEVKVPFDSEHDPLEYFSINAEYELSLTEKGQQSHTFPRQEFIDVRNYCNNNKRYNRVVTDDDGNYLFKGKMNGKDITFFTCISKPTYDYYPDHSIIISASGQSCEYKRLYGEKLDIKGVTMASRIKEKTVKIHCFTDKTRNSENLRKSHPDFFTKVREWMFDNVKKSLVFANTNEEKLFEDKWTIIPVNVHGSNQYSDYHNIVIYGSLNSSTQVIKYKREKEGIEADDHYKNKACEHFYQMLFRTSLRNPNTSEPVNIYLIDKDTAEFIKERIQRDFPDFNIEIVFHSQFQDVIKVRRHNHNPLSKKEHNRKNHLIRKAEQGKIKYPHVAAAIIGYSRTHKWREILQIDAEYQKKGIKL